MIELYGFGARFGVQDLSPFVLKVDAFLRMTGIPFQSHNSFGFLKKSPKGKLPYIIDQGQVVADSGFIIRYLTETYAPDTDNHLTNQQKACAGMITRALDEQLYWCMVHARWIREDSWRQVKPEFFARMPWPVRVIAPLVARHRVRNALYYQGTGRHTEQEILQISDSILNDLSITLGQDTFFFGNTPGTLDAVVYSFLAQAVQSSLKNVLSEQIEQYPNLVQFCHRFHKRYYDSDT